MIRKILIYEVHYSNINRYVLPFAEYLINNSLTEEVEIVYDSFVESDKIDHSDVEGISHCQAKEAYRKLKKLDGESVAFMTYSYRIMDLYWTYKFKKIGVRCFQQQHGMYAEFLERSFRGYFSALPRKITYLKAFLFFLVTGKWSIFLYMLNKDFLKKLWINKILKNRLQAKIFPVQSHHIFVWGDYWKQWFVDNHFYPSTRTFTTIGNPDYHKFVKGKDRPRQIEKVCYIAQTFVEDGRMERSTLMGMIEEIADHLKDKLIIKMHPRSERSLYQAVIDNGGELTMGFPLTDYYIGHYSSLLALAINEDTQVYLLEVNNEEIPDYFSKSAHQVFKNMGELLKTIDKGEKLEADSDISYYFKNLEAHPFIKMAEIFKEFTEA